MRWILRTGIPRASFVLVVLFLTLAVYSDSLGNGFVNFDDDRYIENNPLIRTIDLKRFFGTEQVLGNYHPLVILAYSVIYSFNQTHAGAYHLASLLVHLLNVTLVYLVVAEIFGLFEVAVAVSLLFGIHPIQVESVAWVSELKNVLYTAFFLSSLLCYIRSIKRAFSRRYLLLSILFFTLSALSKGTAVSLPLVLILVDFYFARRPSGKVIWEKVPFFILAIAFGLLAIDAQQAFGGLQDPSLFGFQDRVAFGCYGFVAYIVQLIAPLHLSAFYPYPAHSESIVSWIHALCPAAVLAILALILHSLRTTRTVAFAVGFYAVTVAPVLQFIPVGNALIADRYCYVPSIGIFLLFVMALTECVRNSVQRIFVVSIFVAVITSYCWLTYERTKVWKDGFALWNDVIAKEPVSLAFNNRGVLYQRRSGAVRLSDPTEAAADRQRAVEDYRSALLLDPQNTDALSNLGLWYTEQARMDTARSEELYNEALRNFNAALETKPYFATAYTNRGSVYAALGEHGAALRDFTTALGFDSNLADAWYNAGIANQRLGMPDKSCPALRTAAELGHDLAPLALYKLCQNSAGSQPESP